MKISSLIGLTSLAVNAGLAGMIVLAGLRPQKPAAVPAVASVAAPVEKPAGPAPLEQSWSALQGAELSQQRDRLAAEGFPPSAIRAIIAAQIREGFAARRKSLEAPLANTPFWKNPLPDPQTQAALRALAKEEQKAIRAALGPDPEDGAVARLQRQFPDLAPDKIDQLAAIRERYDEQRQDVYGANFRGGQLTPSERERMNALEKAMHAEFAAVLTPAEMENYDLRTSNTANSLRYRLTAFEPNENEFRTLFRLQSAFDDQFSNYGALSPEQSKARQEAQAQLNTQIEAALGPARYADYQRSGDYNFQQTTQLVNRLGLPPETSTTLYTVQKDFEAKTRAVYQSLGKVGSAEEADRRLNPQLAALQQEAVARVTSVLGGNTTAIDAYKQYGGSWFTNMVPRPRPAAKK